jgi:hypothetical protein
MSSSVVLEMEVISPTGEWQCLEIILFITTELAGEGHY